MKKITLAEFIKENERMIFVLGIFLALFPLSFDTIKNLNSNFAGWIAIATSVAVLLILKNFLLGKERELSLEALLFVGCLATIAGAIALLTFQIYTKMTLSFLDVVLSAFYFIAGLILFAKLLEKIDKKIEKRKKIKFCVNLLFLLLVIILFLVKNIDKILKDILLKINFIIVPILTVEHEMLFFGGIYFMIFIYGVFASGIGYFGQELFYEQFLLKKFKIIRNKWNKFKVKRRNQ